MGNFLLRNKSKVYFLLITRKLQLKNISFNSYKLKGEEIFELF